MALIVSRTAVITMNATGKYVRVSLIHTPKNPYSGKFFIPNIFNKYPFGPRISVNEIEDVNGGEIKGSITKKLMIALPHFGIRVRVTSSANIYPKRVPVIATAVATTREFKRDFPVYTLIKAFFKSDSV